MPDPEDRTLISRAELALHAGVGRAAVSNWENRYESFPRPARAGRRETFDAVTVAAWLDGRRIPTNMLRDGEPEGHDYGSRFRRSFGLTHPTGTAPPGTTAESPGAQAAQWLLDRLKGPDFPAAALWLAFLVYLQDRHVSTWAEIKERAKSAPDWQQFEEAWRWVGTVEPAFRDFPMPELPVRSVIVERSWSPGRVVHLVEEAHHLAAGTPGQTRDRPPSADLFVHLVEKHAQAQGRKSAEHFTPRAVVRLAVDALTDRSPPTPRVYDPFCRTGEFLDEAVTRLSHDLNAEALVLGHNPNRALRPFAQMNLRLHGAEPAVDGGYWWEEPWSQQFDFIFANPPFNMRLPEDVIHRWPWRYGPPPVHSGNYAWLQHVVSRLEMGGRAAVVMPNNAGFTNNAREYDIRAAMVEDGAVECVVGLPPNLFAGTGIPVSLWILRAPAGEPLDVLFIDATDLGTNVTRVLRTLSQGTADRIVRTLDRWRCGENVDETGFARAVSVAELRNGDYKLAPAVHVEPHRPDRDPPAERRQVTNLLRQSSALGKRIRSLDGEVQRLTALIDAARAPAAYPRTELRWLCELKAGPGGSRLRSDVQRADGVPVVLPRHLQDGRIADRPGAGMPEDTAQSLAAYRLEVDDLLISRTAERGRVARVSAEQNGWLFSTGLIRLRVHSDETLPGYLAHVLLSEACHAWMVRHMAGTVVPTMTLTTLAKLPIPVPTREEQEHLTTALDAVVEQARVYTELATTTQSLRETLAQSLFTVPGE